MTDLFPIDWSSFHFLRPQFLWGLAAVAILLVLGLVSLRENAAWKKHIAPHLHAFMISKGSSRLKVFMLFIQVIGFGLGILALAGPTWKKVETPGQTLETPMVILLDLSQSMMADDIQPTRLERAKFKINDFLDAKPGARIALVGYAGTAHTVVPLSRDYNIIKSHIVNLSPKVMPFRGSNLENAMDLADTLMNVTTAPGTVLIFSDDFDNDDFNYLQTYSSQTRNSVQLMPMNTSMGADIPAYSGRGSLLYNGEVIHSELNTAVLSQINGLEKCEVLQITLDKSDVQSIAKKVSENLKFTEKPEEKKNEWQDMGLLLVIPTALIIMLWFRRGWVLFSIFFMLSLTSCKQDLEGFDDLWFTKNYQGQRMSDAGEYVAAAQTYSAPIRKGVAYYKAGEYDDAIKAFGKDTTAMGAYNLGLAYFKNGDYASAQMAFGLAQEKDPSMEQAQDSYSKMENILQGSSQANPSEAKEVPLKDQAKNEQNKSPEDLSGGGQEATKKDMQKERLEETIATEIRKAKELDEVPDDMQSNKEKSQQKVLMQKLDDDPARFLQKKFEYEVKRKKIKPASDEKPW